MYFGIEIQKDVYTLEETYNVINNIYLNGVRIAAMVPTGEAAHFHTDQVDSVKVVTNDEGTVVSQIEYLPYGETWFQDGDDKYAPKYNSQELDKESGYYFYNARYYDPQICRFVTADNVIPNDLYTQSWNRFSYCINNPIVYRDPTGHYEIRVEVEQDRDKVGQLILYNDYGVKVASYKALARGSKEEENNYNNKDRMKQKADTPTGKYLIVGKEDIPASQLDRRRDYGPSRIILKPIEGEAKEAYEKYGRGTPKSGGRFNIHAGGVISNKEQGENKEKGKMDSKLQPTWGCIRLSNEDMTSLTNSIKRIEKSRETGVTKYLHKARNSMFKAFGIETQDITEVVDVK